jgi:alpha-1,6-mannosyltransferase
VATSDIEGTLAQVGSGGETGPVSADVAGEATDGVVEGVTDGAVRGPGEAVIASVDVSLGTVEPPGLDHGERKQLDVVRRFGTIGALLLAAGSLGAGATPVFNPVNTIPILGLFPRMPTVSLAVAFAGMAMVVLAWLLLGRFARPGRVHLISRSQLNRTLFMWAIPLALPPTPMFSKDVYSYLAQSKIAALGLNPYQLGPAAALGVSDPLTRGVPNIWRDTPAPYGPLFITVGRLVTAVSGNHVVTGVYLQRILELIGLAMIVWALPRLARRFGVQPVSALWLGAANPLVLWHLIAGSHNEALMIGLMLAGFEIALHRLPVLSKGAPIPPVTAAEIACLLAGSAVIVLGAAVKISAAPALGFLGVMVARRWGGTLRHLVYAALGLGVVTAVIMVATSVGTGLGFGWLSTLNTNGVVKSWMSPMTALGYVAGGLGIALDLGNHTDTTIGVLRDIGEVVSVVVIGKLLWDTHKGRMHPMLGLGLCMAAVVVLGGTVQPWYLLWAALPLACVVGASVFRSATAAISAVVAMLVPPTGSTFDGRAYVLPDAALAAAVVFILAVVVLNRTCPVLPKRSGRSGRGVSRTTA